jgi:hypothetical protein
MTMRIEGDGFTTVHATGGTFDITGRITLTPVDCGPVDPPEPEWTWPGPATTGVPHGVELATITAPIGADTMTATAYVVMRAGAEFRNIRFERLVTVRAPGVKFINCWFAGVENPGSSVALLNIRDDRPATGAVPSASATRCTFLPTHRPRAGHLLDAVRGSQVRLTACEIAHTVDGVHIFGSTAADDPHAGHVLVESCWIHDLTVAPDPGQSATGGLTHNDAVQIVGGSSIHIVGNDLGDARMASIMLAPGTRNARSTGDIVIRRNRIGVSSSGINVNDSRLPGPLQGLVIEDCEVARQPKGIIVSGRALDTGGAVITGNTWADDGSPVPVRRGA